MTIRIGHLSTFYHTSMLLMARGDADARLGRKIAWRLFGTGPAIAQAFEQRELDLAYIGLPPAIIGIERGARIVCVAGGHMEGTVMAGKGEWKGLSEAGGIRAVMEQFRGQAVGVPGIGSIHDVILRQCLHELGLTDSVTVRNFPWADLVTEEVVSGGVAAAFGTPALAAAITRYAGGKVLVPPQALWPDNPSYGIVASKEFLERSRDVVKRFLEMHEEAEEFIRRKPDEAALIISGYVGIVDEAFILDMLRISPRYCAQLSEEFIAATMRFVPVMQRLGYLQNAVERERIFDTRMIRELLHDTDHYREGLKEGS